ncbi:MAG: IMP dehydrogenase [Verrucomicrobiota bacterium]|nr:IMP dehydrogenase [Verrucomicrobiota bacterium]
MINKHIQNFMKHFQMEGITFDDVSLKTLYSDRLPHETSLKTQFSRNISINIPFVSAAMDTVTEKEMAIAMACLGGIGVIHKNLTVKQQADQVKCVKHYLNGFIHDPVTFEENMRISEVMKEKKEKKYQFSGFPIVNSQNKLSGILTSRDLKFVKDCEKTVKEVMTTKLITAPKGTTIKEALNIMRNSKIGKLPIVDTKGLLSGLYSFHDLKMLVENIAPEYNRDNNHRLRVAAAIGPHEYERIEALTNAEVDALIIDTAHGHSKGVIETLAYLKKKFDNIDVIAGNIGTGEAAKALLDAGADAVKVGIGPGSICTTRVVAGVGVPQLTAIYEAVTALKGNIPVIADGGIRYSGDVAKALAFGASSVMMGGVLAGTEESPGEKILHHGRTYVIYRGMGSLKAMKTSKGSRQRYNQQDELDQNKLVPQGVESMIQYRGTVESVIHQYAGGVRYSLGYNGASDFVELREKAQPIKINTAGLQEAHPHDVKISKDAPNYSE